VPVPCSAENEYRQIPGLQAAAQWQRQTKAGTLKTELSIILECKSQHQVSVSHSLYDFYNTKNLNRLKSTGIHVAKALTYVAEGP
jgi:hypothetical protein